MFNTKDHSVPRELIMLMVRWYLNYKLSYRDLSEMALEPGFKGTHTTIYRWVIKSTPELEDEVRRLKKTVGGSVRADETYIKVKGQWKYFYRAVDKEGRTVDYLLTAKRDLNAKEREDQLVTIKNSWNPFELMVRLEANLTNFKKETT